MRMRMGSYPPPRPEATTFVAPDERRRPTIDGFDLARASILATRKRQHVPSKKPRETRQMMTTMTMTTMWIAPIAATWVGIASDTPAPTRRATGRRVPSFATISIVVLDDTMPPTWEFPAGLARGIQPCDSRGHGVNTGPWP